MGEWLLSRGDRLIVARHEVPGVGVWTFREGKTPSGALRRHDAEPIVA